MSSLLYQITCLRQPDPSTKQQIATFLQVWTHIERYANQPWNLVSRTLTQVQAIMLIAPVQPWYPTLLHMLVDYLRLVSSSTAARWLKSLLEALDIDTLVFSAHLSQGIFIFCSCISRNYSSIRHSQSSSELIFQKFYYRSTANHSFGRVMLNQLAIYKQHC